MTDNGGLTDIATVNFTVAIAPVLHILSPSADALYATTSVMLQWQGWDNQSGIARYEVQVDGGDWLPVGYNTTHLFDALSEGAHTFRVKAVDNFTLETVVQVGITVSGDPWLIIDAIDGPFNTTQPWISWTGGDNQSSVVRYEIRVDSGSWISVGTNTSYQASVGEGTHILHVRAFDVLGNNATRQVAFTVDLTAPTVISHSPSTGDTPLRPTIIVVFSELMDTSSVEVTGVNGTISWEGNTMTIQLTGDLALDTGYSITVNGRDLAGNAMAPHVWGFSTIDYFMAEFSGQLLDDQGHSIQGAVVSCSNGESRTTNSTGHFFFSLEPGHYSFNLTKDGYVTQVIDEELESGEIVRVVRTLDTVAAAGDDMLLIIAAIVIVCAAAGAVVFLVLRKRRA
ncbi:APHP domain protein [Candidatus Moduliflexus flocculans]|uniref:APHP domain protein n=1 Tax=Candidatus Moduliflexus flocculans TaxID=1499966 RepID=A0A081BRB7_9BACT|nr:APHP domain protein [Candidatus Moduliflexus flocculans]